MGRPAGARGHRWPAIIAKLRRTPDRWRMLPEMAAVSARTVQVIRRQENRALRMPDAVVRCRVRAGVIDENDRAIVSLILKLETRTPKEEPNARPQHART